MPRVVENVHDRLPADSALAIGLARLWTKGDKPFFQLITENKDTPKQVHLSSQNSINWVLDPSHLGRSFCISHRLHRLAATPYDKARGHAFLLTKNKVAEGTETMLVL